MSDELQAQVEQNRQLILDAKQKGTGSTLLAYSKLSGPGWLQSAITLGGGSLAGSLYLGIIAGYELLWLQPLMMVLGIVMLSAIGYVALSTKERPFHAINRHINPVLGWGWAIATLMANMVWAMPQFALGTAAMQQNLGLFSGENGGILCTVILFSLGAGAVYFYDSGGRGVKIFDWTLKIMVAVVVLSFFGVVIAMTMKGSLPWGDIACGFVPDFSLLTSVPDTYGKFLADSTNPGFWETKILSSQRDKMVTGAATAVGINMTFLLPYSMLKRGWDKDFRGLAVFDLSTGLFVPFMVAVSCVVIASATQFHGKYDAGLLVKSSAERNVEISNGATSETSLYEAKRTKDTVASERDFNKNVDAVLKTQADFKYDDVAKLQAKHDEKVASRRDELIAEKSADTVAEQELQDPNLGLGFGPLDKRRNELAKADRQLAAMLVGRDSGLLANSLQNLTGPGIAQIVFGIGVLGMAVSTIIILMLINGFTICEMCGRPSEGAMYRFGSILPGLTGGIGALTLWTSQAKFYVAEPTSIFGMVLLPIAYVTFFLMINSKSLLGEHRPEGIKRVLLNLVLLLALIASTIGAGWSIWAKAGWYGVAAVVAFVTLAVVVHFRRRKPAAE
ncbi:MAG: divalent metal cation transporter [Planctomycetota bacterium]|nr:divalent metal cation transporter [Planctomycetota bacterium]